MPLTGVIQLLFDHNTSPVTTTDVTAQLYWGEEGTAGEYGGGVGGPAISWMKSTNQRWSAQFTLIDTSQTGANRPAVGQTFRLFEDGVLKFSGFIDNVDEGAFEGSRTLLYMCQCSSWATLFDHRVLTKVYQQNEAASTVIADIIATIGEGITVNNVIVSGTLTTPVGLDGPTYVSQAFDTIRDMVDAQWWVDENKDLHFVPINAGPALAWSIDDTGSEWLAGSLKVSRTSKDFRNAQYVSSNGLGQPPPATISSTSGSSAPTYTTLTDTYITATPLDFLVLTSQPIQLDPSNPVPPTVKVNGATQTVKKYFSDPLGISGNAWFWALDTIGVQQGQQIAPAPGTTVEITYQAFTGGGGTIAASAGGGVNTAIATKNWVVQSDTAAIAARNAIEGTTGKWEQVTSIPGISDPTVANQLASGLLTRSALIPDVISFATWRSNYAIGGKLTVNIPFHGLNGTYSVQEIQATEKPNTSGPISGSTMVYTVTLSNAQNIGDYIKWMEGLVRAINSTQGGSGIAASVTPASPGLQVVREIPSGTLNGSNKVFTLTFTPQPPWAVWLMLNGVLQHELGSIPDYALSGSTITFTAAPVATDELTCIYFIANAGLAPQKVSGSAYSTGAFMADGVIDTHWVLDTSPDTSNPGPKAYVINRPYPVGWGIPDASPGAAWIGPHADGSALSSGLYKYKLSFTLPAGTGTIAGKVAGNGEAFGGHLKLKMNGVVVLTLNPPNKTPLTTFSISTNLVAGLNVLEVDLDSDNVAPIGACIVQITSVISP